MEVGGVEVGGGGGGGVGVRGFKMSCERGSDFFSTCFVCVGGSGSVPLLP